MDRAVRPIVTPDHHGSSTSTDDASRARASSSATARARAAAAHGCAQSAAVAFARAASSARAASAVTAPSCTRRESSYSCAERWSTKNDEARSGLSATRAWVAWKSA